MVRAASRTDTEDWIKKFSFIGLQNHQKTGGAVLNHAIPEKNIVAAESPDVVDQTTPGDSREKRGKKTKKHWNLGLILLYSILLEMQAIIC